MVLALALISFLFTGSYRGVVRHTGLRDAGNMMYAVSVNSFLLIFAVFLNQKLVLFPNFTIPFSIIVIHYLLSLFILIFSRLLFKRLYNHLISDIKNPLIMLLFMVLVILVSQTHSVLMNQRESSYNVVGFIDDNLSRVGKRIDGVFIYPSSELNEKFVNEKIKEVIVSNQDTTSSKLLKITDKLLSLKLKLR